ncbi:MAG: OmpA family protein [Planctomycetaceae bacterium]|nr:OmpA family protein [Planctomycetaceae bacterium]
MARQKPPEAGVPEWILTYGDMMSLLLCFFIMLYSMSIIAEIKYEALVETLQKDFGYQGSSKQKSKSTKTTAARSSTTERSRRTAALLGGQPVVTTQGQQLKVQTIRIDAENIRGGLVRFALGSDELSEQAKKDLTIMKDILLGSPFKIMIKGHVAPKEQGMYRRDIDLAYARAVNVQDFLMTLGFKEEFFQISVVNASEMPNRAILPAGTDPKLAGASAEVMLIDKTLRVLNN